MNPHMRLALEELIVANRAAFTHLHRCLIDAVEEVHGRFDDVVERDGNAVSIDVREALLRLLDCDSLKALGATATKGSFCSVRLLLPGGTVVRVRSHPWTRRDGVKVLQQAIPAPLPLFHWPPLLGDAPGSTWHAAVLWIPQGSLATLGNAWLAAVQYLNDRKDMDLYSKVPLPPAVAAGPSGQPPTSPSGPRPFDPNQGNGFDDFFDSESEGPLDPA